jgi:DinB superfamily
MKTESDLLFNVIQFSKRKLESIREEQASLKPSAEKWSLKEILGHLIDSAANNHQRFVRTQNVADTVSVKYDQMFWVSSQDYQSESWADLVGLWFFYNKHLSHVIAAMNPDVLENSCDMGYLEPKTLRYVVQDYIRHLEHHLEQLLDDVPTQSRKKWQTDAEP